MMFTRVICSLTILAISMAGCSSANHLAALSPTPTPSPTPQAPRVGNIAPDFTLDTLDGTQKVHLGDFQGKAVLLFFWAITCPPCVKELPIIQKFYAKQQTAHKHSSVLAVNIDRVDDFVKVSALQQQLGLTYPIIVDDHLQMRTSYHVINVPVSYFIDRQHIIRSIVSTPLNDTLLRTFPTGDASARLLLGSRDIAAF